jgi:hypothetical protein
VLTQNGKQVKLTILEPLNAAFDTLSTRPDDTRQASNEGTRMLVAHIQGGTAGLVSSIKIEINPNDTTFNYVSAENLIHPRADLHLEIFPNPLVNNTTISFQFTMRTVTVARIYDLSGRMVHELFNREFEPGLHTLNWNGSGRNGLKLQEGIYLLSITTDNSLHSKKIIIKNQ